MKKRLIGGSFAPPLTTEGLESYKSLAASADRRVSEYMTLLIDMLETFRQTSESSLPGTPGPVRGTIVPLEECEIERIWDKVPWPEECDVIGEVFAQLPAGELRNAAYHLLWYARELAADREPLTADKLG